MHIVLRDGRRQSLFSVEVDLTSPPTIVHSPAGDGQVAHLEWDRALDDEHHLRRCPVCGCKHLFARKELPQLTVFALIVLAAIVATGLYGGGYTLSAVFVLAIVVILDVAIYLFARRELVCYRCRSSFQGMPIRRGHPRWQKTLSQRYASDPLPARRAEQNEAPDQNDVGAHEPSSDAASRESEPAARQAGDDANKPKRKGAQVP